jgi:hypothetical protein
MTEVQGEIIRRMCEGESLRSVCRTEGYPAPSTVILWTNNDPAFAEQYARARDERADVYFDRIDDVSDAAASAETAVEVAGLRLKADNIKWQLARMAPKKYGDKLELGGGLDINNRIERITRKIVDPKAPE